MKLHLNYWLATILATALLSLSCIASDALQLVTEADMTRESRLLATAPIPFEPKAILPGAPVIDVVSPKGDTTLKAPFSIRVQFKPQGDADIVPASFQALYGAFKFDITDRITQKAKVTRQGIEVDQANIPSGNHRLTVRVTDSQGRVGERQISFSVE